MPTLQPTAPVAQPPAFRRLAWALWPWLLVLLGIVVVQPVEAQGLIAKALPQPNLRLTVSGDVSAIVRQSDGKLILGGSFGVVGNVRRTNLARLNTDGSLDANWIVATDFPINALALDASDNLFVGGSFTKIGGVTRNGLAKLAANGTVDANWNPAPNSIVSALLLSGSQLYIAGSFGNVGGTARSGIARVSAAGSGALDQTWDPAPNGVVRTMVETGGNLYFGGGFSQVGGTPRGRLAKVSTTGVGALDMIWNPGADFTVSALALDSNGALIVGGLFSNVGGLARRCVAKLDPIGAGAANATWVPAAANFGCGVSALAADGTGGMLIGGVFSTIAGQPRNNIARVLDAGTLDAAWNPDVQAQLYSSTAAVRAILPLAGGAAQIGGTFDTVSSGRNFASARLTAGGARDPGFTAALDSLGQVRIFAQDPVTAAVYIGGTFGLVDGAVVRRNLLRLAPDLSLDTAWTAGVNNSVYALLVDATQRVYVGGFFTMSGATTRNDIARFDSAGNLDTTWNPNANFNINAMALTPDGSGLYLGGAFTQMGGQTRNRLARVSTSGSGSPPDAWDPNANSGVFTLDVRASDGAVYAGGAFTLLGGLARGYAGKISAGGVVDANWNPNANNWVTSLRVLEPIVTASSATSTALSTKELPDTGEVEMCGFMTTADTIPVNGAIAAEADGTGAIDATGFQIAGPPISINMGPNEAPNGAALAIYGQFPVDLPPPAPPGLIREFKIALFDPVTGIVTPIEYEAVANSQSDPSGLFGALASPPSVVATAAPNEIGTRYIVAGVAVDAQGNASVLRAVTLESVAIFANGFE